MLTETTDEELLSHANRLRVVSQMAVGTDNIDLAACTTAGIPVGYTPDVLTDATADHAFGLLIAAAAENLVAGLAGEPLPACANPEVYEAG